MSKGRETKQAVLKLAASQAAEVGLEGLSIGNLARSLGMSKSGLFAHFQSKSTLQVQVLTFAADQFVEEVVRPSLRAPRGEPRVRSLFEHWVGWFERQACGCIFVAAVTELDDRPGPARDYLKSQQNDWLDVINTVAQTAVDEGDFVAGLDTRQFATEMYSIALMLHLTSRLLDLPDARERAHHTFEALVTRSRVTIPSTRSS